jgi:hypothetical protein
MSCPSFCAEDGEPIPVGAIFLLAWLLSRGQAPSAALDRIAAEFGAPAAEVLGRPAELAHVQRMVDAAREIAGVEPGTSRVVEVPGLPLAPPQERALGEVAIDLTVQIAGAAGEREFRRYTAYVSEKFNIQQELENIIRQAEEEGETPKARAARALLDQAGAQLTVIGHFAYAPGSEGAVITVTR